MIKKIDKWLEKHYKRYWLWIGIIIFLVLASIDNIVTNVLGLLTSIFCLYLLVNFEYKKEKK